jgi:hypothetical protein
MICEPGQHVRKHSLRRVGTAVALVGFLYGKFAAPLDQKCLTYFQLEGAIAGFAHSPVHRAGRPGKRM